MSSLARRWLGFALLSLVAIGCGRERRIPERNPPVVSPTVAPLAAPDPTRPNVLLIIFDDLNDWVEPLGGHPQARTPNFARLAAKGISFTNAHCDAPACNPSRTALLSGLRPSSTGVYVNGQPYLAALPGTYTLVEYFKAFGYRTLGAGKVFHSFGSGKRVWDTYLDKEPDPGPAEEVDRLTHDAHFAWGPLTIETREMADVQVAQGAAGWLRSSGQGPFFMAVGFHKPHLPWRVPEKFFERVPPTKKVQLPPTIENDLADMPRRGRRLAVSDDHRAIERSRAWPEAVRSYLASVAFADHVLGLVLKALEEGPYAKNTLIVATSDHGFQLGEKKHWGKYALWEPATRVPLILVLPDGRGAGTTLPVPVTLVDLFPTLVDLVDLPQAQGLDGTSLAPLVAQPMLRWKRPALTNYRRDDWAARSERFRYIRYSDGGEELYDLEADPHEWTNLASRREFREVKAELAAAIPSERAPFAPFTFSPYDLEGTTETLLRFFDPGDLQDEIRRAAERREARD